MTQNSQNRSRAFSPIETARNLYCGVFAAQTKDDQEIASQTWLALEPRDRSFITAHLQYLNLMAQAQTLRALQGVRETLDNLTGATYAIADVVIGPDPAFDFERGMGDPEELAAAFREADRRYDVPSGGPDDGPPPLIIPAPYEEPTLRVAPEPQPDAGQIATSVLPVLPPSARSLVEAFSPVNAPAPNGTVTRPITARRRSGALPAAPTIAEEVPHAE